MTKIQYSQVLQKQLEKKRARNPSYSLRAFARDLQIDNGNLKKILSGKISVSPKVAYKLGRHLDLTEKELLQFILPTLE
jgi:plasmid maintenance system antidote protein VapI